MENSNRFHKTNSKRNPSSGPGTRSPPASNSDGQEVNYNSKCCCRYIQGKDELSKACGVDSFCTNRVRYIECTPKTCSSGSNCQNRSFQCQMNASFDIIRSAKKYFGLKALVLIRKGEFIAEFMESPLEKDKLDFNLDGYITEGLWRTHFPPSEGNDASKKGRLARFIGHSRDANCHLETWFVSDRTRKGIFAKREIMAGEELTMDYSVRTIGYGITLSPQFQYGAGPSPPIYLGEARPLEGPSDVINIIGNMLQAVYRPEMVEYFMHRLELTSDNVLLRQFVNQGGLRIMKLYINDQTTTNNMTRILSVLEKIPFPYKDPIIDSEIERNIQKFKTHDETLLNNLKKIKKIWGGLPCKRYHQVGTNNSDIGVNPSLITVVTEEEVRAIKKILDPDDSRGHSLKKKGKMKENGRSEGTSKSGSSPNKNIKIAPTHRVHTAPNETEDQTTEPRATIPDNASGNSPVSSLDKQQFRDEFTSIVVKQCERYKKLMDESTFNKHKERCINILYDKELRFFDKEMQRKDSGLDVEHYMNSIRNRVSKFLEDYMKKLIESIKKSKREKESGGGTSAKRERESEEGDDQNKRTKN